MGVTHKILAASFLAVLTGLPVVSAWSFTPGLNDGTVPGLSSVDENGNSVGGIWGVMERHANARRAIDQAYSRTIMENDAVLAISCFDQALTLTSRLGNMFSDRPATNIMPPNLDVYNDGLGVYNPYAGIGVKPSNPADTMNSIPVGNTLAHALAGGLMNTVDVYMGGGGGMTHPAPFDTYRRVDENSPPHDRVVENEFIVSSAAIEIGETGTNNFADSLGASMGSTLTSALVMWTREVDEFMDPANFPLLYDTLNPVSGLSGDLHTATDQMMAILATFGDLGPEGVLVDGIPQYFGALEVIFDLKEQIFDNLNTGNDSITAFFTREFLDLITGILGSERTSMSGLPWTQAQGGNTLPEDGMGCRRIAKLWFGIPGNGLGIVGAQGGGPNRAMPTYVNYSDLTNQIATYAGKDFEQGLDANAPVLDGARFDLVDRLRGPSGTAEQPNGLVSWRAPPPLPDGMALEEIIGQMPPPPELVGVE